MNVVARLVLAFLWALSWLPLAVQAAVGRGLGTLLWVLAGSRKRIALRNLELTMPEKTPAERRAIAYRNFQWIARSFLERGLLWYAPPERLRRLIHVEGDPGFAEREPGAVMWLAPHFVALDVAGQATQLFQNRPVGSIYQKQSIEVFDKAIRKGVAFFNLPDMDFGAQDAVFVPFMGVPAATLTAPSKMAWSLKMKVQPVLAEMLPGGRGYRVRFMNPWTDFPTDDPVADAARMNEWIASEVRRNPSQYYWVHKRFKTRPPGEPSLY